MITVASRFFAILLLLAAGLLAACSTPSHSELPTTLEGYNPPPKGAEYGYRTQDGKFFTREILDSDGPITIERTSTGIWLKRFADLLALLDDGVSYAYDGNLADLWPLAVGKEVHLRLYRNGNPNGSGRLTVVRQERIVVPAGEFDTFVIVASWKTPGSIAGDATRWFAPTHGRWIKYAEELLTEAGVRKLSTELVSIRIPSSTAHYDELADVAMTTAGTPNPASDFPLLPLPGNVKIDIRTPDSTVPPEYAVFSGKWSGLWSNKVRASNLFIESVTSSGEVRGVFVWRDGPDAKIDSHKVNGKIANGTLTWSNPSGSTVFNFKLTSDGKLVGDRRNKGEWKDSVVMAKTP